MYGSSGNKHRSIVCNFDSGGYVYDKLRESSSSPSTQVEPVKCSHTNNGKYIRPASISNIFIIKY